MSLDELPAQAEVVVPTAWAKIPSECARVGDEDRD